MALLVIHECPACKWGVWKMDESWEELLEANPQYRRQINQFKMPHRRQEWLAARALVSRLCGEEKEVANHPNGKPFLTDHSHAVSLSHTRGYVAAIIGDPQREVGIDIEQYGERVHRVAHRYMRADEPQDADTWTLLLHWSAKETLFKCLNSADVDFRQHLRIFPFTAAPHGEMQAQEYRTPEQRRYRIGYLIEPEFVLTYTYKT